MNRLILAAFILPCAAGAVASQEKDNNTEKIKAGNSNDEILLKASYRQKIDAYVTSANFERLVTRQLDRVTLWDVKNKKQIWTDPRPRGSVSGGIALDRNGSVFAIGAPGYQDGLPQAAVEVRSANTGDLLWKTNYDEWLPPEVSFSNDGKRLFLGCDSGKLVVVNPQDGRVLSSARVLRTSVGGVIPLDKNESTYLVYPSAPNWPESGDCKTVCLNKSSEIVVGGKVLSGPKILSLAVDRTRQRIATTDSYEVSLYSYVFTKSGVECKLLQEIPRSENENRVQELSFDEKTGFLYVLGAYRISAFNPPAWRHFTPEQPGFDRSEKTYFYLPRIVDGQFKSMTYVDGRTVKLRKLLSQE